MSFPTPFELEQLLEVAKLRADRARAQIALAHRRVSDLEQARSAILQPRSADDAISRMAQEKWLIWREKRSVELNRDLAIARAEALKIRQFAKRFIAREEVLKELLAKLRKDERQRRAMRADALQQANSHLLANDVRDENIGHQIS